MHREGKGEGIACRVSGGCVVGCALQPCLDAAAASELQVQAGQTASRIQAGGVIEPDHELENGPRAIDAISGELESGDLGAIGHGGPIHRHGHRAARNGTIVIAGHNRERRQPIAIGIRCRGPIGVDAAEDPIVRSRGPRRGQVSGGAQLERATGNALHHKSRHLTVAIAGVRRRQQGGKTDLGSAVLLASHHPRAEAGEARRIIHRHQGKAAGGDRTGGQGAITHLPVDRAARAGGGGGVAAAGVGDRAQGPQGIEKGWRRSRSIGAWGEGEGVGTGIPTSHHAAAGCHLAGKGQLVATSETSANAYGGRAKGGAIAITERQIRIEGDRRIALLVARRKVGLGTQHRRIIDPIDAQTSR